MKIDYLSFIPFFCEGVFFNRGTIVVSDEQASKLVKNPSFMTRVRKGIIRFNDFKTFLDSAIPKASYNEEQESLKINAIKNAHDIEDIKDLVKDEHSSTVIKEADKKMEELDYKASQLKEKKGSLKKARDDAEKDSFKKEAFEINGK